MVTNRHWRSPSRVLRLACPLVLALSAAAGSWSLARGEERTVESPGGELGRVHALVGADIVPRPGERISSGVILVRDGLIAALGTSVAIPPEAQVWDLRGQVVYAGLIEAHLYQGSAEQGGVGGATHENPAVRAERSVVDGLVLEPKELKGLRGAGFTAALVVPREGVFRGSSALVNLRDGSPREQVIRARVAQHVAFQHRGWKVRAYPNSLMGAMALTRQVIFDARYDAAAWAHYGKHAPGTPRPPANESLRALREVLGGESTICFEASDVGMLLRGHALFGEFELSPWVVLGRADLGPWLDELRARSVGLVVSLNFPPIPTWEAEAEALDVDQDELRAWAAAPAGPGRLERAGVRFALSGVGLSGPDEVHARVREAIARGLSPQVALAAFTTAPAALLQAPQLGVIEQGALANLTVTVGELFAEGTEISEVWIDGLRYPAREAPVQAKDVAGRWRTSGPSPAVEFELELKGDALTGRSRPADAEGAPWEDLAEIDLWRDRLRLRRGSESPTLEFRGQPPLLRGSFAGSELVLVRARPEARAEELPRALTQLPERSPWPPLPPEVPRATLIRDAVVWTQGPQGRLERANVLIEDGRVLALGAGIEAPKGARVVEAGGRHLTPGIIDCHSHSFGVGPVNESTHNCTAEVRCADVINPDTIQIYRQLAGGVTAAQQLHGSANAIGGQSALVRLRWGSSAQDMLFPNAPAGIKFALGENPKRSNWGAGLEPRYPTTRMGVNESIRERLLAAQAYRDRRARWLLESRSGSAGPPPRVDLQLEALGDVLSGACKVHAHSYRQDEILALLRLAEELGFRVGTLQHVLEGYKVADEIATHGAGAATFSDWWGYKFEVYDAIAYNAALMQRRGVVVSIKSDSDEMARRLNQEAAKVIRYGGVSEVDALAMITRNPALQLGIADQVGSIEVGKQADLVLWSGHPLRTTSRVEETWIEGQSYFERARDAQARALFETERAALLAAAKAARGREGARVGPWKPTFAGGESDEDDHARGCACGGER